MDEIKIIDRGRGPQLSSSRITVLDVFYYLHRGHDRDFVQRALPSLSREELDLIENYVDQHRDELVAEDNRVEEKIRADIATQADSGLRPRIDRSLPVEERAGRLIEKLKVRHRTETEKNGGHTSH